jgi:hypothetical protein
MSTYTASTPHVGRGIGVRTWRFGVRSLLAGGIALGLVAVGVVFLVVGLSARSEVSDKLAREHVTFTPDAAQIVGAQPGTLVNTGPEAKDFAQIVRTHTLEATHGQTYAQMPRFLGTDGKPTSDEKAAALDPKSGQPVENPARGIWVTSTTWQTSLNMAYMASNLAWFVIGVGALFVLTGLGLGVVGVRPRRLAA